MLCGKQYSQDHINAALGVYGTQHSPECAAVAASMNVQVLQPGFRAVVQGTHDILNWLRSLGRFVSTMLIYLVRVYVGCSLRCV